MKAIYTLEDPGDGSIGMAFRTQVYILTPNNLRSAYIDFHIPEHIENTMAPGSVIVVSDNHQGVRDTIQTLCDHFAKSQAALLDEFDVASFEP